MWIYEEETLINSLVPRFQEPTGSCSGRYYSSQWRFWIPNIQGIPVCGHSKRESVLIAWFHDSRNHLVSVPGYITVPS